jgi:enoyl-CoA hydratase/carnithine racemase
MGVGYYLPKLVGAAQATFWLMTGATVTATDGKVAGLFLDVVPRAKVVDRAVEIGRQIAASAPRRAMAVTKAAIARGYDTDLPNVLTYEAYVQNYLFQKDDHKESLRALMAQLKRS